jgi:glutamate-ammonia-ligase adenylyltransferase
MARSDLLKKMLKLAPDLDPKTVEDFFSRMDRDYLSLYPPKEIAAHLRLLASLDSEHPVRLKIVLRGLRRFEIIVVAFDYFSEFSILCGWLATFGFDIQTGNIYTFSGRILDIFDVRLRPGEVFHASRKEQFVAELNALIRLLGDSRFQEARERLNRRLIEHLEKMKVKFSGVLYPVEIRFDNRLSADWTVMDVRSRDTPAFLYAFSNALAMRGIYIHKVRIESVGTEVRDRFYISDREGKKIEGERDQKSLQMAIALIKQFTHFLPRAPDPAKALRYFDQMLDEITKEKPSVSVKAVFREKEGLDRLAHLLGASDFLWEDFLRMQHEHLLPVLEEVSKREFRPGRETLQKELARAAARGASFEEKKKILNEFKDREMFFIDMKHLLKPEVTLMDFSQALTDLAEAVLDQAHEMVSRHLIAQYGPPVQENGKRCPFSIFGLGKFGGCEMGYASDIELLFVYGEPGRTRGKNSIENDEYFERLARELSEFVEAKQEGIFHIDLRLRPQGRYGPLANPLDRIRDYYSPDGDAAPFERQALIKLRRVAGDEALGKAVEAHRDHFVYGGLPWDLKTALHLRKRQMRELVRPGKVNVKYSRGGIIDIEYAVQYLQILHGKDHPELRTPSTLQALDALRRLRIVSQKQHDHLRTAYVFLRSLIDGLRMVRGNARDLVLPDPARDEFKFLARRLGYLARDWEKSANKLSADIRRHMENVARFFEIRFGK